MVVDITVDQPSRHASVNSNTTANTGRQVPRIVVVMLVGATYADRGAAIMQYTRRRPGCP